MDAALVERLRRVLVASEDPVDAAYVFGSRARSTARRGSDLDVAVLFAEEPVPRLSGPVSRLQGSLERELGVTVDLVNLHAAPADLVHRVLRDGTLVHEGNKRHRVAFEMRMRSEYFDLLPHLWRYRRLGGT